MSALNRRSDRVVVNGSYLRAQARDAVRTFVAPLSGVYNAAVGIARDASQRSSSTKPASCKDHVSSPTERHSHL